MRASVFVATSLDGFLARENGDISWLGDPSQTDGEDFGYQQFISDVDTMVMGRRTYETARSFGEWPYGALPVVVLSSSFLAIPDELKATVTWLNLPPMEVARQLEGVGATHLYVDGGDTIQRFLRAGLIQRMVLTRLPVLLGAGVALFGRLPHDLRLAHGQTLAFPNGFVQSEYTVLNDSA